MTQFDKPIEHERQSLRPMADEIQLQPQQRPRPSQPQPRPRPPSILGRYGFAPSGSIYEKEKYKRDLERWNKEKQRLDERMRKDNPALAQVLDNITMGIIDPGSKPTGIAKGARSLLRKFAPGSDEWIDAYLKGMSKDKFNRIFESTEKAKEKGSMDLYVRTQRYLDEVPSRQAEGFIYQHGNYPGHRPGPAIQEVPRALDEHLLKESTRPAIQQVPRALDEHIQKAHEGYGAGTLRHDDLSIDKWAAKPGPRRHMRIDPSGANEDTLRKLDDYIKNELPKKYETSLLEASEGAHEAMAEDANNYLIDLLLEQPPS